MHLGVMMFPTDKAIDPVTLARAVEDRGFESLWFPEHSHIPTSRATPWGGREGAPPLPEEYWRTHDSLVSLGACAAVTTTLKLATGICLVAQRDPIWLAKEVATVDRISNGRFLFGVGYGWNKEELAHHGVRYGDRRDVLRERVLACKQLWTQDEASFDGDHVHLDPSWSWPKPVQQPHPPVILGGAAGPRTFAHIAEFCDGWMPIAGRHALVDQLDGLREACEAVDRDPSTVELGQFATPARADALEELAAAGVSRAVFGLPPADADTVLPLLDRYAELLDAAP